MRLSRDDDGLVVKSGFGHTTLLARQSPRTVCLRDDLVHLPHTTDECDGSEEVKWWRSGHVFNRHFQMAGIV